nr:N-6 DNA methylase [Acidimicrobiia bacterium]
MPSAAVADARKRRGDYPTPGALVDEVIAHALPSINTGQRVTVLDPACGDGRFLEVAAQHIQAAGGVPVLVGVDVHDGAVRAARQLLSRYPDVTVAQDDALRRCWGTDRFDLVVGNPPYLSQLATATTRRVASAFGGGPYADTAVEFLALAVELARPDGGCIGLVLPQSVLSSRDAADVRAGVARRAELTWSWWSDQRVFDAAVLVCALAFRRGGRASAALCHDRAWTRVVTDRLDVPALPAMSPIHTTLGDRVRLTANFRDQYYGLVPAVADHELGPPFVTSGLVDPGHCRWGEQPVTFARRRFARPRVDLERLSPKLRRWADGLLVPKVVIANQTAVIEAVADPAGEWLPGVPLLTARPLATTVDVHRVAAVLT